MCLSHCAEIIERFVRADFDRSKELTTLDGEKGFREGDSEGSSGVMGMVEDIIEEFRGEMGEVVAI